MDNTREISALLHLIDDPDEDVYSTVSDKIISFGKSIIPNLEKLWEDTPQPIIQERIELLIHRVHFRELSDGFTDWRDNGKGLLEGALLVARYHYPDLQTITVMQNIEKIRRNIWLELNNFLTPLEQINNVITSILYNYHKLKGVEIAYDRPDEYLINKVLETKKGNALSNGIIYLILCQLLDLPVKAVNIPRQFILGYFDTQYEALNPAGHPSQKIVFFIDPVNGQVYTHRDVENYFKRISVPPTPAYYRPLSNTRIIQFLLEELSKCFDNEANSYKMEELLFLSKLIDP
jgi:regulator of sirC expression with transglutaminase-like and TPR domain